MVTWLLLGTVLYLLTVFFPSVFLVTGIGLANYLGSRDNEPQLNPLHGRAKRAARNFRENYPVFMALGILVLVVPGADQEQAVLGAILFVLARLAYLPLYLSGLPVLRPMAYVVGLIGLTVMGLALL